jgi:hypothetical protein
VVVVPHYRHLHLHRKALGGPEPQGRAYQLLGGERLGVVARRRGQHLPNVEQRDPPAAGDGDMRALEHLPPAPRPRRALGHEDGERDNLGRVVPVLVRLEPQLAPDGAVGDLHRHASGATVFRRSRRECVCVWFREE